MGYEPPAKTERNKQLEKDYKSGVGMVELVTKYQITPQRIYQIVGKAKIATK